MITLQKLLELQEDLQEQHMGGSPRLMSDEDKMLFLAHMKTALDCEIVEALDETGWKPWASSNHMNNDRYLSEMVDALHFFLNLILVAGASDMSARQLGDLIEARYLKKREKNAQRQIDGYDGIAGKCMWCHTDLEEAESQLQQVYELRGQVYHFCCLDCMNRYEAQDLVDTKQIAENAQ